MNRAFFLDRDGVINIDKNYVHRIEDFDFIDGIFELCKFASQLDFKIFVITNQAGIGRGYYTTDDFFKLTDWMLDQFNKHGIDIDHVYYCPYHPSAGIGTYKKESFDRKPNPGMILKAKKEFQLDLSNSVLLGDKNSDVEAGRSAGIKYNLKLAAKGRTSIDPHQEMEFSSLHGVKRWFQQVFCY